MKVSQILKRAAKRGLIVAVVALMLASCGLSASASTFVPYTTYTFDYDGNNLTSPHAYVADEYVTPDDMNLAVPLTNPSDMLLDKDGNLYIADTGNNRVVFFDSKMQYLGELSTFYNEGAIIPDVQLRLETETAELQTKFDRRIKKFAEDEEAPVTYDLTLDELTAIEQRMAPFYDMSEDDRMANYTTIAAEYAVDGRVMPTFEHIIDLLDYVMPVKYKYDALTQEAIDEAGWGETEEERHCVAYYNAYLMGLSNEDPSADSFNAPEGLFVTDDGTLYVADTGNKRVVVMPHIDEGWKNGNFPAKKTFYKPESSVLAEDFEFKPANLVVDSAKRLYVDLKNVNSGIMQLNANGEFMGYFGAQKVSGSVVQWFLQLFQTDEQRARTVRTVPRVYNNIAIDTDNFVWVTTNSFENMFDMVEYLNTGDSGKAPVKRLNPSGNDVLVRNGLYAPGGDIVTMADDLSSIVDVAIKGDTGIYTLVDNKRNKMFTYDSDGNLLYAFGGTGGQLGVFKLIAAAVYQGTDLLVLDQQTGYVTRFKQTDYAVAIEAALTADNERNYSLSEENWKKVQKLNSNFDLAYIGLAKCYQHSAVQAEPEQASEYYQKAMEYYKQARNTEGYSKAFKEYRSLYVRDHLLLVLAVPIVLLVLIYLAIRAINKVNAKLHVTGVQTTLKEELCFGWRAIFHPISGFWEIKREKRGTMRAALIIMAAAVVAFCFQSTGTAYMFNNISVENVSLLQQAANVILPIILWVLASWAFTTLMSGEGSIKDIFIAACYALIPMVLLLIPVTLISNVCSLDEEAFLTFFNTLAYVWLGVLIVFGSMVVQDYSFSKNLLTVILSIFGMAAIMFIVLLLISLTGKMFGFLETIYQEIAFRL